MKKVIYGVYGAGGFGREVMPLVVNHSIGSDLNCSKDDMYFIVDSQYLNQDSELNGCDVVDYESFLDIEADERYVTIAVADGGVRERLAEKCKR